ncbi:glycosyltransferase [Flavihumibacter rivuli]|uniref:glycosyltransferase family 2 protein n=1 Tax=Flavihumibacter rivuli TaxID=2838156 RepID=UPI001BDF11BF|nr:glycosyltransferase [Flavihumibacter rivuli]ULQ56292.1 glycosyltransferase [Flavihumibacter rivuli]
MQHLDRIPATPPRIAPLPTGIDRPLWSVMIPVYNCYGYIERTLRSVLDQDAGPEQMQIEIIDDASTDGDIEAMVHCLGKGRVQYFRQPVNRGSLRNFESCINRAKGYRVHILHGDDMVKPGFYQEIEALFKAHPEAGAAFTRNDYIDERDRHLHSKPNIQENKGIIENWLFKIASANLLQPPAIVVKRSVYEHLGGFFAVHYGEDWEMWARIAAHYPVAYSPESLALYRKHNENITANAYKTGQCIRDIEKVISIIQGYVPDQDKQITQRNAKRVFSQFFGGIAQSHYYSDREAFFNLAYQNFLFDKRLETLVSFGRIATRHAWEQAKSSAKKLLLPGN